MDQKQEEFVPVDIEPLDAKKAEKMKVLLAEDIAKYTFEAKQHYAAIAQLEAAISKSKLIIADIDRRVAGADYPVPPPEQKSQLGQPVGGKK